MLVRFNCVTFCSNINWASNLRLNSWYNILKNMRRNNKANLEKIMEYNLRFRLVSSWYYSRSTWNCSSIVKNRVGIPRILSMACLPACTSVMSAVPPFSIIRILVWISFNFVSVNLSKESSLFNGMGFFYQYFQCLKNTFNLAISFNERL